MMNKIVKTVFFTAFCMLSSGCATRMTVIAGLADNIKEYYTIYPSIEIDIAAVTEEEADELKKADVDGYFSVGSSKRESLSPYTFMFSAEQTAPQTMKYNVPQWDKWLEKEPEKIVVIVNMPRKTEKGEKGKDPRILILDMSSGFMHHKTVYVEAKPGSVVRIYKEPTDPEKMAEKKRKEAEQKRKAEEKVKREEAKKAKKKEAEEMRKKEAEKKPKENKELTSKKKG